MARSGDLGSAPHRTMPNTLPPTNDATNRRQRVLAVASGGGHWVQLMRLRPAFSGSDVTWVTVSDAYRSDVSPAPFRTVPDATRWNRLGLIRLAVRLAWIVLTVRPDVVVTTGAAPGFFACMFGRLVGARTAWIDSMANVDRLSMSGQAAGRWSDLWLTQWEPLSDGKGPQYRGAVL
ncbi:MAG: UDP-N-acetylglucosamine--LPS N-acetylglucosamine transferase [Phycisphaerales bacterium]